jgi:2-polyprenyl-3-methyl-5-hydroxy-6-metoxy-1,4-benzoquinol methylase
MTVDEWHRERAMRALVHMNQVKIKLESGEYATESLPCFCGANDDLELVTVDRYKLPHRLVVCQECALIRANPRMTAESYRSFYNNEYRKINYPWYETYTNSRDIEAEALFDGQIKKGNDLKAFLAQFDRPSPKVVVDFGCHLGGMLMPFKPAELHGVEIDTWAAEGAGYLGITVVPTIDELIVLGVKADLVIMQDVIEHLTDLHEVEKIGQILAPNGLVYVWTPGLFQSGDVDSLWQVAHTHQFCARTLEYVMGELGFNPVFVDEDIAALFEYVGKENSVKWDKPVEWVEYTKDAVFTKGRRKMPPFRGVCKFPAKELYENIDVNLALKLPDLHTITGTFDGSAVIVGGGPSVDGEIEQIRKLRQAGAKVIVISRMYPWCASHNVQADFVVSLDCMAEQEAGFTHLQPNVTYLMASVSRPAILKMLVGKPCYIWDTKDDYKTQGMRRKHGYEVVTVVNGGGSVTISCISLAMNLGFTDLHVFGLDCMATDVAKTHATGIAGESVEPVWIEVEIEGVKYHTSGAFLEFARQTLDMASAGHEEGLLKSIKFYGESLVNKLWDGTWQEELEDAEIVPTEVAA